jgi:hypothetical protein
MAIYEYSYSKRVSEPFDKILTGKITLPVFAKEKGGEGRWLKYYAWSRRMKYLFVFIAYGHETKVTFDKKTVHKTEDFIRDFLSLQYDPGKNGGSESVYEIVSAEKFKKNVELSFEAIEIKMDISRIVESLTKDSEMTPDDYLNSKDVL